MGILYFGIDLELPSVLWMRRMLDGLADHVQRLVLEEPPGAEARERFSTLVLDDGSRSFLRRAARRLHFYERVPVPSPTLDALVAAAEAPEISALLVHYTTLAVKYDRAWTRISKPIYVHCHGYDVTWDLRIADGTREHPGDYEDRVRALPEHLRFIANSHATAGRLFQLGIAADRVMVKYLGVPVPETPPRPAPQDGSLEILYLGRLIDCKGPDLVIRAFELASQHGLDARLTLAGDGPLRGACEELRARSPVADRIALPGSVSGETGEALRRRSHLFTAHNQLGPVSRQEEAFGVAVVEAMAAGLPVITGRNGSLPEVMEHGEHGLLVEPGDIEAHAEAFLRLANDPQRRRTMGRKGWERAREHFTLDREMRELRRLLGLEPGALDEGKEGQEKDHV